MEGISGLEKIASFKTLAYNLYVNLLYRGIYVVFDCNKIPTCLWDEKELLKISLFQQNNKNERIGFNLTTNKCNPVVDILPDLTAIRCFGLSHVSKVKIQDFPSFDDLYLYYLNIVDRELIQLPTQETCKKCTFFLNNSCYGGCLANKNRAN
jgi:cyclic pyranopterin phosphate synthase